MYLIITLILTMSLQLKSGLCIQLSPLCRRCLHACTQPCTETALSHPSSWIVEKTCTAYRGDNLWSSSFCGSVDTKTKMQVKYLTFCLGSSLFQALHIKCSDIKHYVIYLTSYIMSDITHHYVFYNVLMIAVLTNRPNLNCSLLQVTSSSCIIMTDTSN